MENQGTSLSTLFRQALVDPLELSLAEMELLLARFPYAQPLHFAKERRKFLGGELDKLDNMAVLLASSPSWLYEYVQTPVVEIPHIEVEDDDYIPFEDVVDNDLDPVLVEDLDTMQEADEAAVAAEIEAAAVVDEEAAEEAQDIVADAAVEATKASEEEEPEDIAIVEEAGEEEAVEADSSEELNQEEEVQPAHEDTDSEEEDTEELDELVQVGIGAGDYFALHSKDPIAAAQEEEKQPEPAASRDDDMSLYNDDLMPYSFRWWLHKTRLAYAETYQPYASSYSLVKSQPKPAAAAKDEVVLDQQIRQHIIHLQKPEDKLSDAVKSKEVQYTRVDKTSEVIEKFIREEPQIQAPQPDQLNTENKARKSSEEVYDLVTETLANIYANQTMYVKAIEVYKKLILKFPEKKSYFATQIKSLEEKLY